MTRNNLTGSQYLRNQEILNRWLVFEPNSNENIAISGTIYTVPVGQFFSPTFRILSGSYDTVSGSIQINKDIHLFDTEQAATEFLTDVGLKNVACIKEREIHGQKWTEIHLINYPKLSFSMEIDDFEEVRGYRVEVFKSGSYLEEAPREVKKDNYGNIISDTYLKYFELEVDK